MYTRCPECQTAFRVTVAQLKARDGLVRCGRCDSIFRADLHLFAAPAAAARGAEEETESEAFIDLAAEAASASESPAPDTRAEIPIVSDLSLLRPRRSLVATALWSTSAVVLAAVLLAQFAYFYRHELAQLPGMRPRLADACRAVGCEIASLTDKTLPELLQTSIAPHPRYTNALRIRASLVNRTQHPQPLPLLQISLTDSDGKILARRAFAPRDYLDPGTPATPLGPHVVVQAMLDVTNPENKAAGYEVQLFRRDGIDVN